MLSAIAANASNRSAVTSRQIENRVIRKMAPPKSAALQAICDFAIFEDSPQMEAKFGGVKSEKCEVKA